jgi:5-methylcytosine-specific restriction protein A
MGRFPRVRDTPPQYNEQGQLLCRNCDKLVAAGRRHYCSKKCMNMFRRNNTWRFVRKAVLRRDKFTCQICDTQHVKSGLDVDHTIPVRFGVNPFDKDNLRTLCKACHKAKTKLDHVASKHI